MWLAQLHLCVQDDVRAGIIFLHGHVIAPSILRGDAVTPVSISICPPHAPFVSNMIKEPPCVHFLPQSLTRCQFCTVMACNIIFFSFLSSHVLTSLSCKHVSFRTILLSVISLLNEPNTFSPANVDASVMYRKWRDSKGKDREYIEIIRYKERSPQQRSCHAVTV